MWICKFWGQGKVLRRNVAVSTWKRQKRLTAVNPIFSTSLPSLLEVYSWWHHSKNLSIKETRSFLADERGLVVGVWDTCFRKLGLENRSNRNDPHFLQSTYVGEHYCCGGRQHSTGCWQRAVALGGHPSQWLFHPGILTPKVFWFQSVTSHIHGILQEIATRCLISPKWVIFTHCVQHPNESWYIKVNLRPNFPRPTSHVIFMSLFVFSLRLWLWPNS